MMSEASFASLGPTLLARKGGAKPAMRPQLTPLTHSLSEIAALADEQLEDLGWNDMGTDRDPGEFADQDKPLLSSKRSAGQAPLVPHDTAEMSDAAQTDAAPSRHQIIDPLSSADIVPIASHVHSRTPANEDTPGHDAWHDENTSPVVHSQQKRLARSLLADAAMSATDADASGKLASRQGSGRRAAFTLRLDTQRHLKLRLAATMQGVSAQSLVTEALDAMLDSMAELDTLLERMKRE